MFLNTCRACGQRQLIFPSQVTSLTNTAHGIVVDLVCWCGAEQTLTTGKRSPYAPRTTLAA